MEKSEFDILKKEYAEILNRAIVYNQVTKQIECDLRWSDKGNYKDYYDEMLSKYRIKEDPNHERKFIVEGAPHLSFCLKDAVRIQTHKNKSLIVA